MAQFNEKDNVSRRQEVILKWLSPSQPKSPVSVSVLVLWDGNKAGLEDVDGVELASVGEDSAPSSGRVAEKNGSVFGGSGKGTLVRARFKVRVWIVKLVKWFFVSTRPEKISSFSILSINTWCACLSVLILIFQGSGESGFGKMLSLSSYSPLFLGYTHFLFVLLLIGAVLGIAFLES